MVIVGSFMIRGVARIDFADAPAAIASFLTLVTMPFTFSITDGIAFGIVSYALLLAATGRAREAHPLLWPFAALFLGRYAFFT